MPQHAISPSRSDKCFCVAIPCGRDPVNPRLLCKARKARDALAKTHAVVLVGQDVADAAVISACSDLLKTSGA